MFFATNIRNFEELSKEILQKKAFFLGLLEGLENRVEMVILPRDPHSSFHAGF